MRSILFIWFPYWCLQRMLVAQPELQSKAVVLYSRDGKKGDRVVACSRQAVQWGVRRGMPLQEVQALRVPQVARKVRVDNRFNKANAIGTPESPWHIAMLDPGKDAEQLKTLAVWCRMFTPLVGFEPLQRDALASSLELRHRSGVPEGLVLDITGSSHLWGGPQHLAGIICERVTTLGYRCRVAVAPQLGAAWALAHADPRASQNPLVVLDKYELESALGAMPMYALRIPISIVNTLHELGLTHWKHLSVLPRQALQTRFGNELLQRWDQAWGNRAETWDLASIAPEWEVSQELEHGTDRRDLLGVVLRQLTDRLCHMLRESRRGILQLACHLRSAEACQLVLNVNLYCPTAHSRHLCDLIQLQLEQVQLKGIVHAIRLVVVQTGLLADQQLRFWSEDSMGNSPRQIAPLIDRLSNRLGRDKVLRVLFQADVQPEHAYRLRPWLEPVAATRSAKRSRLRDLPWSPLERPLYLLETPIALELDASPPGIPRYFRHQQKSYQIARYWGPERIETGWWRRPMVRRDYYRVETQAGDRLWLFQCQDGSTGDAIWYVHGVFG
ncbi:MAG: DNA polymerase Y family protein [Planctomycetota bacterium]|nr:DNA polymerase Y family protein [Planctomycetota bacterium]MDA1178075.1 DNA polymerase Y family protein [Planctomycetota bacterium]